MTYEHTKSEYALQDALTYAAHHGALGENRLLVHGKRAGSHPDIVSLLPGPTLGLLELKISFNTPHQVISALCQLLAYAHEYASKHTLANLAVWYCHARVQSFTNFSYRGKQGLLDEETFTHKIEQYAKDQVARYADAGEHADAAVSVLSEDFGSVVSGGVLQKDPTLHVAVSELTLAARDWSDAALGTVRTLLKDGLTPELLEHGGQNKWVKHVLQNGLPSSLSGYQLQARQTRPSTWLTNPL